MPQAAALAALGDEVGFVRLAFAERRCCLESFALHLRVAKTALSNWLNGHRGAPAGLLLALGDHLDAGGRAWLLRRLAARWGLVVEVVAGPVADELAAARARRAAGVARLREGLALLEDEGEQTCWQRAA